MNTWLSGVASVSIGISLVLACSSKKNDGNQALCKVGSLGCFCRGDGTCDDDLSCMPKVGVCVSADQGLGGAFDIGGDGEAGDDTGTEGGAPTDQSTAAAGETSGGSANHGGSFTLGGSGGSSGGSAGGSAGGGTAGSTTNPFPDSEVGCAIVTSCPSCCETVGVYALDPLGKDATRAYVTAFDVTATSAAGEYSLATSDEIGGIFFRFKSPQSIGSLSVVGTGAGGSLEIALVRAGGLDGCIYPIVGGSLSPVPDTCWGLGAGPYAALPADQIDIRVRSAAGGRAALSVTQVEYSPP